VSSHDDDILDFDFYDEPPAAGRPDREPTPRRQRREPPTGGDGGGGGLTPLLRLVGLIAFAILIVVLLAVWFEGCQSDRKRDRYETYVSDICGVGAASAKQGKNLNELLTTPGLTQAELETRLTGLTKQAEASVAQAESLDPPGPLESANEGALDALEFRVLGLEGMRQVFKQTAGSDDEAAAGAALATQARRFIASDVVWDDLFRAPAKVALESEDITGVEVCSSDFLADPDFATARVLTPIWKRVQGASTGGTPSGLHGNEIASVKVLPSGQLLSTTTETIIKISTDLSFEVAVTNSGDSQEIRVKVTLTIPKQPSPIVKEAVIQIIDPGQTVTVTFTGFGNLPTAGDKSSVKVDVDPVPGETNTTNNTFEYPVIFSF
jgi:CARDB